MVVAAPECPATFLLAPTAPRLPSKKFWANSPKRDEMYSMRFSKSALGTALPVNHCKHPKKEQDVETIDKAAWLVEKSGDFAITGAA